MLSYHYTLSGIKSRTVGDGQHGTARWATDKEIRQTYAHVPFNVRDWRKGVPSRTLAAQFSGFKINACEIREDFCRRSNTMHHPVIYRNAKLLYRTVAYPAIPYVLTQNDEADRAQL